MIKTIVKHKKILKMYLKKVGLNSKMKTVDNITHKKKNWDN